MVVGWVGAVTHTASDSNTEGAGPSNHARAQDVVSGPARQLGPLSLPHLEILFLGITPSSSVIHAVCLEVTRFCH